MGSLETFADPLAVAVSAEDEEEMMSGNKRGSSAALGKKPGSVTFEERYSRPVPSSEVVTAAQFTVTARTEQWQRRWRMG